MSSLTVEIKNKDLGHIEIQNENYVISKYSGRGNVTPMGKNGKD